MLNSKFCCYKSLKGWQRISSYENLFTKYVNREAIADTWITAYIIPILNKKTILITTNVVYISYVEKKNQTVSLHECNVLYFEKFFNKRTTKNSTLKTLSKHYIGM